MRLKFFTVLLFVICIIAACKKEENFSSRISFVNTAISNPSITLKADSQIVVNRIRYDSLINTVTPSGTFSISLFANDSTQFSLRTNLESGQPYISMVYEDTNSRKYFFIRKDALPAAPEEGRCSIRIFNAILRSPTLYLANDIAKQRQVYGGLSFANFLSSQSFTAIDTIPRASICYDSAKNVLALPQPLRSGKIYTLYLIGRLSDTLTGTRKPKVIMQVHN